jgi:hypothetical protein
MADPYKPDEAVILFVEFGSGVYCCCLLTQTYFAVTSPSELDFRKQELTRRKIPWDNFGQATGNMNGFGNLVDRTDVSS